MTNKEAIEYIKRIFVRDRANELHFISHDEEIALNLAVKALEDRPTGKWNVISMLVDYVYLLCSECGKSTRLVRDEKNEFCCIKDVRDKIIACPYCGAKMKKEAEND